MQTSEQVLAGHPFVEGLSTEHVTKLASYISPVRFDADTDIFRAGSPAETCYLLYEGDVALEVATATGKIRTIATLHAGDVLGWSWLFEPYRWSFDAHALTDGRALAIDGRALRQEADRDHEFGYQLMQRFARVMVERLQATRLQLLDIYGRED